MPTWLNLLAIIFSPLLLILGITVTIGIYFTFGVFRQTREAVHIPLKTLLHRFVRIPTAYLIGVGWGVFLGIMFWIFAFVFWFLKGSSGAILSDLVGAFAEVCAMGGAAGGFIAALFSINEPYRFWRDVKRGKMALGTAIGYGLLLGAVALGSR